VALDQYRRLRIGLQYGDDLVERRPRLRAQIPFVEIEQDVGRQVDLDLAALDGGAEILQRALQVADLRLIAAPTPRSSRTVAFNGNIVGLSGSTVAASA
jgi:hypothetical protein